MLRPNGRQILIGIAILVILTTGIVAAIIAGRLHHLDTYKAEIIAGLEQSLGRRVQFERGDFSLRFGPAFTFTTIVIKEKDGHTDFLTADRLTFRIAIVPLLGKKLVVRDLLVEKPSIQVGRDRAGLFSIRDLLERKGDGSVSLNVRGVKLTKATIRFHDEGAGPEAVTTVLKDLNLSLDHLGRGKQTGVKLSTELVTGGKAVGAFTLSGSVRTAPQGKPITESVLNLKILAKNLDAGNYWPYYSRYVPFRKILGTLDIDGTFKGKLAAFTSKGSIRIQDLRFDYPQIFHAVLTPRDLRVKYDFELTPKDVLVKAIDVMVDAVAIKGSCAIRDIDTRDPRITARASTSQVRLEQYGGYIPYGIIVKHVADFIEEHIKGGLFRLDDGRLDGRVSQILHMERGDNYNVLFISGRVEQGLLTYGTSVPTFNTIKGELEMRGKDFNLRHMSGNFGKSPFTLDGKITNYPVDAPSAYPFTMVMSPRQGEVSWLFGGSKGLPVTVSDDSQLHLRGDGFTNGYNLSGEWRLTQASYSYPDVIVKPAGRSSTVLFRGSLNSQEAKLETLQLNLAPLAVTMSASYNYGDKRRLALDLKSNLFQLGDVASMLPLAKRYQAGGKLQATLHGEGTGKSPADNLAWSGTIGLGGFACKPAASFRPLTDISGNVNFSGTSFDTSYLQGRIGSSLISGRGSLSGFKKPALHLSFTSPSLNIADLGLKVPSKELTLEKVQGEISLKDEHLQIPSFKATFNNSTVQLKGSVKNFSHPVVELTARSPHLELADILLLTELQPTAPSTGEHAGLALQLSVEADTARLGPLDVTRLNVDTSYEDKVLYLRSAEASTLGGRMTLKGRGDFSGVPRYQAGFNLHKVSSERLMKALGVKKQEFTGALSLQGELTAKGKEWPEIKTTALGLVKLRSEAGTLKRFAVLSKIFSILNVSQLLKFQLPDMVSGGMPYNQITGSFSFRDGVVATNDLFVASNALNISAVGKVNLVKNEIDATVGVQPLQTIDKVVSNIPIVGWLLTGKEKSLITAYFEAKGRLDDPTVSAIPVKAMARGVFDVFKRLFELPGKLITDTGEVITGR